MSLISLAPEMLEEIAFYVATNPFLGPPSALIPLLSSCRTIYDSLSINSNDHLYAQIFTNKFDMEPPIRRLGSRITLSSLLASELRRRCIYLKRIKYRLDALAIRPPSTVTEPDCDGVLRETLWMAYLMMLENDGKNEMQLREYAGMDGWLKLYWFNDDGASLAKHAIRIGQWPSNSRQASLAMWLFWFLLVPGDYGNSEICDATDVLKVLALAAHQYNLTSPSWVDFTPTSSPDPSETVTHYGEPLSLIPPPLATPAILSFVTLLNMVSPFSLGLGAVGISNLYVPIIPSVWPRDSCEWECEWERCCSLGQAKFCNLLTGSFRPGSIEGLWEGIFTYTEFTAYAALLSGTPPLNLRNCLVAQHRQTWKLREHHLLALDPDHKVNPLSSGNALRSYFPTGTIMREDIGGLDVHEPERGESLRYQRSDTRSKEYTGSSEATVLDIIITGEGHSAWGQFSLTGRVRPCDGFVSLSKEYSDGDRGRWLYRGYLIGNVDGHLSGRWRDTLSPPEVPGYEGCFTMSRRR